MKEYGGYLPIELYCGREYYQYEDMIKCNCGRSAIILAIKDAAFEQVYIPYFLCGSVADSLTKYNINWKYYHIDESFMPIDVQPGEREAIILVNYFGVFHRDRIISLSEKYRNVIVDNTQAFFEMPIEDKYNVYSCRKFFGVSDGAYLVKNNLKKLEMQRDQSAARSLFLLESHETGTNANYQLNIENEQAIEQAGILGMSLLTERILQSINYEDVKRIRIENYNAMWSKLSNLNELTLPQADHNVPMVYPLLIKKEIRQRLVENNLYVPQWWKYILQGYEINHFEQNLAKYLLPLPVDQRYNLKDIDEIAKIVLQCM